MANRLKMKYNGLKILIKRVLSSSALLLLVVSLVFLIIRIAPGNPANKFLSPDLSPKLFEKIQERYAFEGSFPEQYFKFIKNIFSGDLGYSITFKIPVTEVIFQFLSLTIILAIAAFITQTLISVILVFLTYRNKSVNNKIQKLSLIIYTVPSYVIGLYMVIIFSVLLGIMPISGLPDAQSAGILDYSHHLILPVVTLSLPGIALFFSYLNDAVQKNKNEGYVLLFRSIGMSEKKIFLKHILPNSIVPLLSIVAIEVGFLLSGSLIVEVLYSLPGFGKLTFTAFMDRDYPLIIGTTLFTSFVMIFSNMAADLIKYYFDKRFRELI